SFPLPFSSRSLPIIDQNRSPPPLTHRRRPMTTVAAPSKSSKKSPVKVRQTKMLIDGKWVDSVSGRTFESINPATGEVIAHVAEGEKADIDKAVKAARKAFDKGPWKKMNARERGRCMYKLADLIEQN